MLTLNWFLAISLDYADSVDMGTSYSRIGRSRHARWKKSNTHTIERQVTEGRTGVVKQPAGAAYL